MKYRVKFTKTGPIKYIGHLDVMRYFQKVIRRADIPIAYSEGFSPHQILSFAFPLSVGFTSEGEYFDMELTQEVNCDELISQFNANMNEGMSVSNVKALPDNAGNCMASVFAATYRIMIKDSISLPDGWKNKVDDYFSQQTIPVNKPKKKGGGFIEIDLKEFLYDFRILDDKTIEFTVNASSANNIKPDFVMNCLFTALDMETPEFGYNIHRVDILGNKCNEEKIDLVSLMEI